MGTLDVTVSMLEAMPANSFVPVSQELVLSDLVESHRQIAAGQGFNMEDALNRIYPVK